MAASNQRVRARAGKVQAAGARSHGSAQMRFTVGCAVSASNACAFRTQAYSEFGRVCQGSARKALVMVTVANIVLRMRHKCKID
eukprot:6185994-Pleurochrysis_carterae.AAC.1